MGFLLRAAFWIAVVAFFMPDDPAANAIAGSARHAAVTAASGQSGAVYAEVAGTCLRNPELCQAGLDAFDAAQDLAIDGIETLAAVINDEHAVKPHK